MDTSVNLTFVSAAAVSVGDHVIFEPESYSGKIENLRVEEETDSLLAYGREITFTLGGKEITRSESDTLELSSPLSVKAGELDGNGDPITLSEILLLKMLETINAAGGVVKDGNDSFYYIDETEAEWPDLGEHASTVFEHLSVNKKIKAAHLIIHEIEY